MATYEATFEGNLRRAIRDIRALDPLITILVLTERLNEQFHRSFDRHYISKLVKKEARRALRDSDRTQIEQRMQFTRENYRMMRERLLRIVYWDQYAHSPDEKAPWNEDVIEAAKNIVMLDLALLKAEIDTGMYKKPTDALVREMRYEPLPPEIRAVIIAAWRRGGMLPEATVQEMVPEQVQ